jgi:hypothetical protein
VGEVAAQFAGGLSLREEFPGLGLDALDGVRAGNEITAMNAPANARTASFDSDPRLGGA